MNQLKDDLAFNASLLQLQPHEEVEYAFIKTIQNKLNDATALQEQERQLQQRLLQRFKDQHRNYNPQDLTLTFPRFQPDELTPEQFQERVTSDVFTPFIISGFLNDTKAVQQWSLDYLTTHCPDVNVSYSITDADERSSGIIFDTIKNTLAVMKAQPEGSFAYIHNTSQLFKEHPELLDDLQLDRLRQLYAPLAKCIVTHLFLSNSPSHIPIHAANEVNSFLMINGRKQWTLIDPRYSCAMNGVLINNARNAYVGEDELGLYDLIPKYIDTVEAGDMLVFGPWWWHTVTNLTPLTIAVATRWSAVKHGVFTRGNSTYQNIQHSNKDFQKLAAEVIESLIDDEIVGDDILHDQYGLSYNPKKDNK